MKILLVFTLILISGEGETKIVRGYSGGGVLIKCTYEAQYTSNPKYLCKDSWSNCADQIKSGDKNEWINSGRFSLFDDTGAAEFWVMITELTVEDSGMYRCGVDRKGQLDVYTAVKLRIKEDQDHKKSISVTGHVGGSVSISCKYPQYHRTDPKFLCRRAGSADCSYESSVKESRRWINEGKLYLHDDGKQIFTVIIHSLTEGDSGEYWCGAESDWTSDHGYKVYLTQINLRVTESPAPRNWTSISEPPALTPSPVYLVQTSTWPVQSSAVQLVQSNPTGPAVYSSISVGIVLLTTGLVAALYYKIKPKGQETVMRYSGQEFHSLDTTTNQPDLVYQNAVVDTVTQRQVSVSGALISELVWIYKTELRMKILLIFTLFLISGGGESGRVTGYSGGGVLIKCRYETQYTSNPKYLCTGSWPCMTKPVWTDVKNEWINRGRFSLFDDTRAAQFWVLITELTVEDSGTYRCAVDIELAIDVYTPVELKIEEDQAYEKSITVTGHVGGSVNISCKYPQSHSSDPKFLCKKVGTGGCTYNTPVKESRRWINQGKLYLHDDRAKKTLTVSLYSLTEGDSGEYWCGAESDWTSDHGYKVYITQINLTVTAPLLEKETTSSPSSPSSRKPPSTKSSKPSENSSLEKNVSKGFPSSSVIAVGSVILLLLLIGLLFFTVVLRKRSKTPDPASTQSQPLRASSNNHKVPSADCDQIKDTRNCSDVIYSTAELSTTLLDSSVNVTQPSAVNSAEVPTYATVNLSKKAKSSTDAVAMATINKENNSCNYAIVKH
ncbi:hypothetical protein AOLI_G00234240 [Acnodon oligacanthus]